MPDDDPLAFARGVVYALIFGVVFWAMLAAVGLATGVL